MTFITLALILIFVLEVITLLIILIMYNVVVGTLVNIQENQQSTLKGNKKNESR
jgi:hypothetical protein